MVCTVQQPSAYRDKASTADYKIASRRKEYRAALGMVYRAYVKAGLSLQNSYKLRVTPFHVLPTTEVLIASCRGEPVCTATLVRDGHFGLPMDAVYGSEIESLRRAGVSLAEVSCLADRRAEPLRGFAVLERLMSLSLQIAAHRGVDQVLIAIHPRHAKFYERFLGFEPFAGRTDYPSVCNRPAVALSLDLNNLAEHSAGAFQRVFGRPFPEQVLAPVQVPEVVLAELRQMAMSANRTKLGRLLRVEYQTVSA